MIKWFIQVSLDPKSKNAMEGKRNGREITTPSIQHALMKEGKKAFKTKPFLTMTSGYVTSKMF